MPSIEPGQQITRLTNSTTGRSIYKGIVGTIGGLQPELHQNRVERWTDYGFMPVQWTNGLWSNMAVDEEGASWEFYPPPPPSDDDEGPESNPASLVGYGILSTEQPPPQAPTQTTFQ